MRPWTRSHSVPDEYMAAMDAPARVLVNFGGVSCAVLGTPAPLARTGRTATCAPTRADSPSAARRPPRIRRPEPVPVPSACPMNVPLSGGAYGHSGIYRSDDGYVARRSGISNQLRQSSLVKSVPVVDGSGSRGSLHQRDTPAGNSQ